MGLILIQNAYSAEVLSEKIWCTENTTCHGEVLSTKNNHFDTAKAGVILVDQFAYQGIEGNIGATHTFYLYNSDGSSLPYTIRAKLCDQRNKCFNYEKRLRLEWKELYSETVNSNLGIASSNLGRELIYAETELDGYPKSVMRKEASLILSQFPYD